MIILAVLLMKEFTIMVKDLIPSLLGDYSSLSPTYMVVVTWALLIVPLTLIKDISTLAYVSGVSLILSALLAAVIIKTAPFGQNVQAHGGLLQVIQDYGFRPHLFTTICIFTEVFAWQHGIFPFLNSLRHPNMKRWRFVTSRVNTLIAIIYLVVSVPAYLGYLDDTAGDIFLNLPSDGSGSTLTNIARYCFLFICIMTYPLEMLVVRDVVKTAWNHPETATITHNHLNDDLFLNGRELLIVLTLDVFALLLGLWLHDLSDACALVGALGGSIVCFIIPGMIYIGVNGDSFIQWTLILTGDEREYGYYDMAEVLHSKASKPWWFYVLGFPLWCYIAHVGKTGVDNKLTESSNIQSSGMFASFDDNSIVSNSSFISSVPSQDDSVISNSFFSCIDYTEGMCGTQRGRRASKIKFVVSICLIVFGLVNLVIGLVERFE
jgi:amino acid permease